MCYFQTINWSSGCFYRLLVGTVKGIKVKGIIVIV
jgi:hypothetical protein